MKNFLFLFFTVITISASAQTAEEIIQKYTAAMGGLEKYKAVKTVVMNGKIKQSGMEIPLKVTILNGRAVRTDIEVQGQKIIETYKEGKGWTINPFAGITSPQDATEDELKRRKSQTQITGNLMDYKARGNRVELMGPETVEGAKTYKLKLTLAADNSVIYYFILDEDWRILKTTDSRNTGNAVIDIDAFFSDFREVNGIQFPFSQIQKTGEQVILQINFDSIELNTPVDEKIFDKPGN